jgi:putative transposase
VLVEADRFYPSSKTCSGCGAVNATLPASHRRLHCDSCGLVVDRDINAARNLAALASGVRAGASVTTVGEVQEGGAGSGPGPQPPGLSRELELPVEAGQDLTLAWGTGR